MSNNPFLNGELQQIANEARDRVKQEWAERLAAGKKMIEDAGIKVGDIVTVSWKVDDAYGGGIRSQMGPVARIDDWIEVNPSNRSPGHLRLPLASMHHVRLERGDATTGEPDPPSDLGAIRDNMRLSKSNPFMVPKPSSDNPFMAL